MGIMKDRNFGFDFVRVIAITLVIISHGGSFLPSFKAKSDILSGFGYYGVELFFILSGFLIGRIIIITFEENNSIRLQDIKIFLIRRWFRTIPNYMLFLVLNITVFQYFFGNKEYSYLYFLFMQNIAWENPSLMPESWSLTIEEWFYVTAPFVIFIVSRFKFLTIKKSILYSMILYILLFTGLRIFEVYTANPTWDSGVRKVVLYRLDSIAYGVIMAYLIFYHENFINKWKYYFISTGVLLLFLSIFNHSTLLSGGRETFFNKILLFTITSIALSFLLIWFKGITCNNLKIIKLITYLSTISYSIYLIHLSFVIPFIHMLDIPKQLLFICYILITIILSTIIYVYYEKPFTELREKF